MFIARSLVLYPGLFEENRQEMSDEIIIPSYHLNKIMENFDDNEMLYLDITNTDTNMNALVTIGSSHSYDKNMIFVPQWILDIIGCTGTCDSVIKLKKADIDEMPAATKISIKPLDPIAFELDILACFEKAFMNLHSIREGITIPIPVSELGNDYIMFAHIEKVEPASVSRIVKGEVDVEFINEFKEDITPSAPTSTPEGASPILNSIMPHPISVPLTPVTPVTPVTPFIQPSNEERRQAVRESWLKRSQITVAQQ